ncbi:d-isomer specific 2-hydroxyacid dehydrogenase family protein [Grosmannia clavigera kw1407]|uniref:D-isomer specific 2-hydroxyacid dehydrogenase family protein n=1 Tax=Grosmannia clavigera (strain kw1407 / UAMH 11150) TaxID=655863 RepID=F0XU26_GROCL|nr:d-isomer specific 2-hydroxyacid dehydrogenase family protein [Grosmannia clavigera kw1407]EFW98885.1 d-isomer specific 2-hydroxyacid dehydrogenase family protein [Grosmannia clavigera kw1407]
MAPIQVAVLDDYMATAEPYFKKLDPDIFDVTIFQDTILPYGHPKTTQDEKDRLVRRLEPFQIISTMRERTPFPAALIERLPNLQLLLTTGTRNLSLDLEAFRKQAIPVGGTIAAARPAGGPDSTVQHFIAVLLAAARNVAADDLSVKTGGWQTGPAVFGLSGKVYATVGLGRLGAGTAKILHQSFGMRVLAWSPNLTQAKADEAAVQAGLPAEAADGSKTFLAVSRECLFRTADVLAVHVVLSDRSRGLIAAKDLALLKQDSIFVNTSRGPIVVEEDLLDTLRRGSINRAALDVFDIEPLPADSPWRTTAWGKDGRSRVTLTPHTGYGERVALEKWYELQVENIVRWHKGEQLESRLV